MVPVSLTRRLSRLLRQKNAPVCLAAWRCEVSHAVPSLPHSHRNWRSCLPSPHAPLLRSLILQAIPHTAEWVSPQNLQPHVSFALLLVIAIHSITFIRICTELYCKKTTMRFPLLNPVSPPITIALQNGNVARHPDRLLTDSRRRRWCHGLRSHGFYSPPTSSFSILDRVFATVFLTLILLDRF
jgi:hypothetical protein